MTAPRQMCSSPAWDRETIRLSLGQTALGGSRAKLIGDDILGFWLSSVAVLQQAFAFMTRGRPTQTGSGGASLTAEPLRRSAGPRAGVSGERGIDGEMNLRGCSILPRQEIPAIADTQRCRSRWFRQRDVAFTQRSSPGEDQRVSLCLSRSRGQARVCRGNERLNGDNDQLSRRNAGSDQVISCAGRAVKGEVGPTSIARTGLATVCYSRHGAAVEVDGL